MLTVVETHDFNVSAGKLWDLIGDFSDVKRWGSENLKSCTLEGIGIGSLRTLKVMNEGQEMTIVDRLEDVKPNSYSYSIVSSPLPLNSYFAKMEVVELKNASCRLLWSSTFTPKGMSANETETFVKNMYHIGFNLIETALKRGSGF